MAVARSSRKKKVKVNETEILERAYVNQLVVIVIGESRVFAGEVVEVDNETGQILAVYITGGTMLRYALGQPPTCGLLRDWTDKQTVFSLCPRKGWNSLMEARDVLEPLYREWLEKQKDKAKQKTEERATTARMAREILDYGTKRQRENKMKLEDIPSVEDIDLWHDRGDVGTMYIACQNMAGELRSQQKRQDENELFVAHLIALLQLDREEMERSNQPIGNIILSRLEDLLSDAGGR